MNNKKIKDDKKWEDDHSESDCYRYSLFLYKQCQTSIGASIASDATTGAPRRNPQGQVGPLLYHAVIFFQLVHPVLVLVLFQLRHLFCG